MKEKKRILEEFNRICKAYGLRHADIDDAFFIAFRSHEGEYRDEGTPYILHPLRVIEVLLKEFSITRKNSLILGLLHDVAEGEKNKIDVTALADIRNRFGEVIASEVTVLTEKIGETREERDLNYIENIKRSSLRVKFVKLADRIDNVRCLVINPRTEKVSRYASESRGLYLDLATRTSSVAYSLLDDALQLVEDARLTKSSCEFD